MLVYVLNINKQPLMPTSRFAKVRKLLKQGKAKVVKTVPFTIQLLYQTNDVIQDVTLGIDSGSKIVGVSATTTNKELYSGEFELRNDIVKLLSEKRQYRRHRRSRKTRYRQSRFLNRKRKDNWLAPSVSQKVESHISIVKRLKKLLPINKIIVEVAQFDIQLLKNSKISGCDYQQGEQLGFFNVREYVLYRDNHTCQNPKCNHKDKILNVHHIESRQIGGNSPGNLITLCETCHKKYHKGELNMSFKRTENYKDATFMSILRWNVYNKLKESYDNVHLTYGYITKNTRINNLLPKEHRIDAMCISKNIVELSDVYYYNVFKRKHNRQIHKANFTKNHIRKLNQTPYKMFNFRLFDLVSYNKILCYIFGRRQSGSFDIRKLNGEKISAGISCKKLKLIQPRDTILTELRCNAFPHFDESECIQAYSS